MFCAIYELMLKDEADDEELARIWRQMTLLMKQRAGAIGSRLHRDDADRLRFIVYTQWPDREQWMKGKRMLQTQDQGVQLMRSLAEICESKVICESNEVEDLLSVKYQ